MNRLATLLVAAALCGCRITSPDLEHGGRLAALPANPDHPELPLAVPVILQHEMVARGGYLYFSALFDGHHIMDVRELGLSIGIDADSNPATGNHDGWEFYITQNAWRSGYYVYRLSDWAFVGYTRLGPYRWPTPAQWVHIRIPMAALSDYDGHVNYTAVIFGGQSYPGSSGEPPLAGEQ